MQLGTLGTAQGPRLDAGTLTLVALLAFVCHPWRRRYAFECDRVGVRPEGRVVEAVARTESTSGLELRDCELTDSELAALAQALGGERGAVRKLALRNARASQRAARDLLLAATGAGVSEVYVSGGFGASAPAGGEPGCGVSAALVALLQGGARSLQALTLARCRLRRLDVRVELPQLQALSLDRNPALAYLSEWSLASGCPNLRSLSLVGSGVRNLWTAAAALRRLPLLTHVWFQTAAAAQASIVEALASPPLGAARGGAIAAVTVAPARAEVEDMDASVDDEDEGEEEEESDGMVDLFDDLVDEPQNDMGALEALSDEEEEDEDDALHFDLMGLMDNGIGDGMAVPPIAFAAPAPAARRGLDFHSPRPSVPAQEHLHSPHHGGGAATNAPDAGVGATPATFIATFPDLMEEDADSEGDVRTLDNDMDAAGGGGAEGGPVAGNIGADAAIQQPPLPAASPRARSVIVAPAARRLSSPICCQPHYREFMLTNLPSLRCLDGVEVNSVERAAAAEAYAEHFQERLGAGSPGGGLLGALRAREMGGSPHSSRVRGDRRPSWGSPPPAGGRPPQASSPKMSPPPAVGGGTVEQCTAAGASAGFSPSGFRRAAAAAAREMCAWPSVRPLKGRHSGRPRQFEYHPSRPEWMVYGTLGGEVCVVNHQTGNTVGAVESVGAPHSVLGLCWLQRDAGKLIAGTDSGAIQLYDVNHMRAPGEEAQPPEGARGLRSGAYSAPPRRSAAIYTYDAFEQLTSVHINCTDTHFLASGYSNHVGLYDLRTGKSLQTFKDLHKEHINVLKFTHHSPSVFATSSFDKEIKLWDLRQPMDRPLYATRSTRGNVMVCFSPDDHYLLSSAVDNEVRQHLASDGRLHTRFDLAPAGSAHNYTRAYYMNGRDYVISGSCEENTVHICCSATGRRLRDVTLEGRGMNTRGSLYVQSLRADPTTDFNFSVLAAYNNSSSHSEICKVDLLQPAEEETPKTPSRPPQAMRVAGMGG